MHVIYSLSHNDMVYVGQTNDMTKRLSVHKTRTKTHSTRLYNAMRIHGFENFKVTLLDYADNKADADILEQMYIGTIGTLNMQHHSNGYAHPGYGY